MKVRIEHWLTANWKWNIFLFLPAIGLLMHLHVFNKDLQGIHAWRQCETASNVLRFAEEDMDILSPHVYSLEWEDGLKRMEFPVMQWVMAAAYKATGNLILSLRAVSWLIGILGVWAMYFLCWYLFRDKVTALLCAWAYHFSPVFFYYTLNPLPDNLALMAMLWSLAFFLRHYRHGGLHWLWFSAAMACLAGLAKLPFVVLLAVPIGYLGMEWLRSRLRSWGPLLLGAIPFLLALVPVAAWYAWVIPQWSGNGVVKGILDSSLSELPEIGGIFLHNLISTLPELLLNYAAVPLFLLGLVLAFRRQSRHSRLFLPFLALAFGVSAYFIFEINMIGKAHDYYLFPFLPGLFLLVGLGLHRMRQQASPWTSVAMALMLLLMPVTAAVRAYPRWEKTGFTSDLLTEKVALQGAVPKEAKIVAGHDLSPHIYLYHLQKRGWTISKDNVDTLRLRNCINAGAEYLYSSHRELDGHSAMQPFLGPMIQSIGDFRIYALRLPEAIR